MGSVKDAAEHVFGEGYRIHPVTKRPLENGIGHLSDDQQAQIHLADIEREGPNGKAVADAMRAEMAAMKNMKVADRNLAKAEGKEPF